MSQLSGLPSMGFASISKLGLTKSSWKAGGTVVVVVGITVVVVVGSTVVVVVGGTVVVVVGGTVVVVVGGPGGGRGR